MGWFDNSGGFDWIPHWLQQTLQNPESGRKTKCIGIHGIGDGHSEKSRGVSCKVVEHLRK